MGANIGKTQAVGPRIRLLAKTRETVELRVNMLSGVTIVTQVLI